MRIIGFRNRNRNRKSELKFTMRNGKFIIVKRKGGSTEGLSLSGTGV